MTETCHLHHVTAYVSVSLLNLTTADDPSHPQNHDNDVNITHLVEIEREQKIAPMSRTRRAPPGVGGEGGEGNFWVPVYAHENGKQSFPSRTRVCPYKANRYLFSSDTSPSLIMWFFDSRSGVQQTPGNPAFPSWVDDSVGTWLEQETALMESKWGPADSRAAIAFVHIPL